MSSSMSSSVSSSKFVLCPHCSGKIEIVSLNCGIFRHAVNSNGVQLSPHASQAECEYALRSGALGCAKPFRVIQTSDGTLITEKCDYI